MCQAFQTLRGNITTLLEPCCSFFSILMFAFSAIKGPAKELRLSFLSGEKYLNKIFVLFSGSESDELSPNLTFESRELSFKMTPAEDFFKFNPPPAWISRVFDPPSRENFQNPIRRGGADFFWNNPMQLLTGYFHTSPSPLTCLSKSCLSLVTCSSWP